MVLVDSSVWVDYLSPRTSTANQKLESLVQPENQIVITGLIFQEVLQGIRNERSFQLVQKLMGCLPFLVPDTETYVRAAALFRRLSSKGQTISTVDIFLASLAIQYQIPIFSIDKDFRVIQEHSDLKLLEW